MAGARWVDDQISTRVHGWGPVVVDRLVAHAIANFDPEAHEKREDDAKAGWDVTLSHPDPTDFAGTSHLQASGDTLTLKGFYDLVCALAHQLHLDGDPDPLGARKIKALGTITALATGQPQTASKPKVKVYAHVDAADLDVDAEGGSAFAAGEIEKLGAATLTKIRDWVGHHQVVIQPVLNMQRGDAVDVHDPPTWMRELVDAPRRPLHLPPLHHRRQILRPRPHRPLRPRRTTRPNPPRQPRLPLPTTPPRQDHRTLAIHPHAPAATSGTDPTVRRTRDSPTLARNRDREEQTSMP